MGIATLFLPWRPGQHFGPTGLQFPVQMFVDFSRCGRGAARDGGSSPARSLGQLPAAHGQSEHERARRPRVARLVSALAGGELASSPAGLWARRRGGRSSSYLPGRTTSLVACSIPGLALLRYPLEGVGSDTANAVGGTHRAHAHPHGHEHLRARPQRRRLLDGDDGARAARARTRGRRAHVRARRARRRTPRRARAARLDRPRLGLQGGSDPVRVCRTTSRRAAGTSCTRTTPSCWAGTRRGSREVAGRSSSSPPIRSTPTTSTSTPGEPRGSSRRLSLAVARFVNGCDIALAPSTHVADWLYGSGVRAPIELLEAPADVERVPLQTGAKKRARVLGLSDERVALYVGRLAEEKRLDELLQEFVSCLRRFPTRGSSLPDAARCSPRCSSAESASASAGKLQGADRSWAERSSARGIRPRTSM